MNCVSSPVRFYFGHCGFNSVHWKYTNHANALNYSCKGTGHEENQLLQLNPTPAACGYHPAVQLCSIAAWITLGKPSALGAATHPPGQGDGCPSIRPSSGAGTQVLSFGSFSRTWGCTKFFAPPQRLGRGGGCSCMAGKLDLAHAALMVGNLCNVSMSI